MNLRSETIKQWWPTTQSLDLVEGPIEKVAAAALAEVARFLNGEPINHSWEAFPSLDAGFRTAPEFSNVPTFYLVLPTHSKWIVLWNNSFLCDGYDSLCYCLTVNHGLTTIHWAAHDEWTTFQSGATFQYRRWNGSTIVERIVQVAQEDKRWLFHQSGEPLPEEDVIQYTASRKKERLNEINLMQLLGRLGAFPWSDQFYAIPGLKSYVIRRVSTPSTIIRREFKDILQRD
jgi:hypothetical protein